MHVHAFCDYQRSFLSCWFPIVIGNLLLCYASGPGRGVDTEYASWLLQQMQVAYILPDARASA